MQLITTLCDRCYQDDESQVPSDGTMLIEVNSRGTEIDLCTKHTEELTDLLSPYYEAGHRPDHVSIKNARPSRGKQPIKVSDTEYGCPMCSRSFPTRQGVTMHCTRTHSTHGYPSPSVPAEEETPLERKRRRDRERHYAKREMERQRQEQVGV